MNTLNVFLPFLVSFLTSFLTTPLVIKIYRHFSWLDDPRKSRHPKVIHKYPVPRGGGIPIFLSILVTSLLFLPLDKHLIGILLGGLVLTIVGILDDLCDLNPYLRLTTGLLAAGCVIAAGIGIAFVTNPFNGIIRLDQPQIPFFLFGKTRTIWVLSDLFALFWILWCQNFVNWSKGIDGQLPGIVVVASLTIAFLSLKFSADITQWQVATLAAILAASYLGFLPFNFYPQKIMPGFGGGSLAGYFLAVLTILSTTKVGTAMIVLGVPMIDAAYSIIRRILKGQSPVWGDRGHLHHRLLDLGFSKRKIAVFYWLISIFLGFLAFYLNSSQKFYTIVLLAVILGGFILWFNLFGSWLKHQDHGSG